MKSTLIAFPARLSPPVLLALPSPRPRLLPLMEKGKGARRTMAPCLTFPQAIFRSAEWLPVNPLLLADSSMEAGLWPSIRQHFSCFDYEVQRTLGPLRTSSTSFSWLFEAAIVARLASTFFEESF